MHAGEAWECVHAHATATAGRGVVPHVGAHVHLQIPFCGKSLAANCAFEGLITGMCTDVNLQRRC